VPGAISPGVKLQGREADHSPPPSDEVRVVELYRHCPIRLHDLELNLLTPIENFHLRAKFIIDITQFRVSIATNFPGLTRCMNVTYAVGRKRSIIYFSLSFSTDNILMWLCEVYRSRKPRLTTVGIRCADHTTPSIRKSWRQLRQQAAVARSV
jgi:hypothetical protein